MILPLTLLLSTGQLPPDLDQAIQAAPDADTAVDTILSFYAAKGYPALDAGVEELADGFKADIKILPFRSFTATSGNRWQQQAAIRFFQPLLDTPVHLPTLEAALARYHKNPLHALAPELSPSADFSGVNVDLSLDDSIQNRFSLLIDNRGVDPLPRERLTLQADFADLAGYPGLTNLAITSSADPREYFSLGTTHTIHHFTGGQSSFFAAYSGAQPRLDEIESDIDAWSFNLSARHTFDSEKWSGAVHYRRSNNSLEFGGDTTGGITNVLQLEISRRWSWDRGMASLAVLASPGGRDSEHQALRPGAESRYLLLRSNLAHRWALPADFSLGLNLRSQLSTAPILQADQFALGGLNGLRSLPEFNQLGDDGFTAQLELSFPKTTFGKNLKIQPSLFLDSGLTHDQVDSTTHTDTALGLILRSQWNSADLNLSVGQSLRSSDSQIYASLLYSF